MKSSILHALPIVSGLGVHVASAQRLAYTSFVVTECITGNDATLGLGVGRPVTQVVNAGPGKPSSVAEYPATITLAYTMPPCISCDCPDCTLLSSFTTVYPAFDISGAQGTKTQNYAITETYIGLSSLSRFEQPTQLPYGFATGVETCDVGICGPEALTATMTYPADGGPAVGAPTYTDGPRCSRNGGDNCAPLSTRYQETETPGTATAPLPVPIKPTAVVAGGNMLRGPVEIVVALVLLIAVP